MAAPKFSSLDQLVEAQYQILEGIQSELVKTKRAILDLKHQDKVSFNIIEASKATGYGTDTLYKYIRQGLINVTQMSKGTRIVIAKEALVDFIMSRNDMYQESNTKNR
jgi:Helix-turn-helix domain